MLAIITRSNVLIYMCIYSYDQGDPLIQLHTPNEVGIRVVWICDGTNELLQPVRITLH